MNILFVCTGNTCRSPMAEGYFRHLCEQASLNDVTVGSAGTFAGDGMPPSSEAIDTLKRVGVDIAPLRSSELTVPLIRAADLIVAMTWSHKNQICLLEPDARDKTKLLLEFSDERNKDVADPVGAPSEVYRQCFETMKTALDNLFLDLKSDNIS